MRASRSIHRRSSGTQLNMTTLIDVVFLLLVFFVWTADFRNQKREGKKPAQLKIIAGTSKNPLDVPQLEDFDDIVIKLAFQQRTVSWLLNDDPQPSFQALGARLRTLAAIKNDVPVIVDPDGEVPFEEVVRVHDAAELAGFQKVGLAVEESK